MNSKAMNYEFHIQAPQGAHFMKKHQVLLNVLKNKIKKHPKGLMLAFQEASPVLK